MGSDAQGEGNQALSLGLTKPWFADESPEHRVYTKSFFIDKYEVTNLQYYIFCQATDHRPPNPWKDPNYPEGRDHYPVTHVNFFDAAAFAKWAGKRLPTEHEWEKAARGNLGRVYPWGNEFDASLANISRSQKIKVGHRLEPVGHYPLGASPYGVEDMIGNVWEWVWDYYLPYPDSLHQNKDYSKKRVVVRGLSFVGVGHFPGKQYMKVVALKARTAFRENLSPMSRRKDLGFRCVKDRLTWSERFLGKKYSS